MIDLKRAGRVLGALKEKNVSQMLITDPLSIYYITGVYVQPMERFYALLLRENGDHVMFLNKLFTVPKEIGVREVWSSDTESVAEKIAEYVNKEETLGVDKDLKARFLLPLMELGAASGYVNASEAVDTVRGVKDEAEQQKMRVASDLNDKAMARFRGLIHEGVTEKEAADQMLAIYIELGADGFSFEPLVAFGKNAADPHHAPDNTVIREGDCVLFDVGCIKDNYCSDMTRTFFYRCVNEESRRVYETVRRANEAAIARIKPGVPLCELDAAARDLITAEGYGPYFNHRLGHFIGLSEHEYGDVSSANTRKAEPGMIFSIEPGIYLEGNTGVRIEDLVLVTNEGCEVLNKYPKELQIIE